MNLLQMRLDLIKERVKQQATILLKCLFPFKYYFISVVFSYLCKTLYKKALTVSNRGLSTLKRKKRKSS